MKKKIGKIFLTALLLCGCQTREEDETDIKEAETMNYDFGAFKKVKITGIDLSDFSN